MNFIFISETDKFGKLRIKESKLVSSGSGKIEIWVCDCGREITSQIRLVIRKVVEDVMKFSFLKLINLEN